MAKELEAKDIELKDYIFTPKEITVDGNSVIDYTDVENDKIFLCNKKDILDKPRPSWIPELDEKGLALDEFLPVCVKDFSDGNYFVQSKIYTGEKDSNGKSIYKNQIYKMSPDVLAATVDYYLKRKRAELKTEGSSKKVSLPRGMKSMPKSRYNEISKLCLLCDVPSLKYKNVDKSITDKAFEMKGKSQGKLYQLQNNVVFLEQWQPLLENIKGKRLDMNYQKQDYIDSYSKGVETAYGDSKTFNNLYNDFGVKIKKQNGTNFSKSEIEKLSETLKKVYAHYGNLSELAGEYGLKISYADNCMQFARKAIGLYSSYHNAIGISFFNEEKQLSVAGINHLPDVTLAHEVAHWLDSQKGKESHNFFASDKYGTLENQIATKFKEEIKLREKSNKSTTIIGKANEIHLGKYWYRTCECFARAMEQFYALKQGIDLSEEIAYARKDNFEEGFIPLIEELMEENKRHFGINDINHVNNKEKENKLMEKTIEAKEKENKLMEKTIEANEREQEMEIYDEQEEALPVRPEFFLYGDTSDEKISELKEHLSKNGYDVKWQDKSETNRFARFTCDIDDKAYIQTILEDRGIDYKYKLGLLATGYDAAWLNEDEVLDAEVVSREEFKRINELREKEFKNLKLPYIKIDFSEGTTSDHKPARMEGGTVLGLKEGEELLKELNNRFNTFLKCDVSVNFPDAKDNEPGSYSLRYDFHDDKRTLENGKEVPFEREGLSDYIRMTCSYPEVLEKYEQQWQKVNAPNITEEQKEFVSDIISSVSGKLEESYKKHLESLKALVENDKKHKKHSNQWIISADVAKESKEALDKRQNEIAFSFNHFTDLCINYIADYLNENKDLSFKDEFISYAGHQISNMLQDVKYGESRNAKYGEHGYDFDFSLWRSSLEKVMDASEYNSYFTERLMAEEKRYKENKNTAKDMGMNSEKNFDFTSLEAEYEAQLREQEMEIDDEPKEALPVWSINGEAFFESEIEESLKADVEELFRQYDSGEREKNLTLVGVKMYGVPTKDGKISLLVEFDSKNPENRWREDSLFNALNEEGIEFNGMKVDFNPITKEKSGTIEQYLKLLEGFENEEQLIKANAQKFEENTVSTSAELLKAGIASMPEVKSKKAMNAFDYGAIYQAKFRKSLENGTSPFLPKNGKVDLVGVYNMRTNELHRGITQIMLQEVKAELGVSTGGFVSAEVVQNARKQGVQTGIKQGSHGFDILVENKDKTERQVVKWFHESQIDGVENLKTHLEQKMRESAKYRQAFIDKKYPGGTARDASLVQTDRPNTKEMICSAKSPDQYLGQVLAGISTGTALLVSPETEALFKEKTMKILTREHKPGVKDKMGLLKLAASANTICKGTVKKMYEMKKENPKVEKKVEPEMGLDR